MYISCVVDPEWPYSIKFAAQSLSLRLVDKPTVLSSILRGKAVGFAASARVRVARWFCSRACISWNENVAWLQDIKLPALVGLLQKEYLIKCRLCVKRRMLARFLRVPAMLPVGSISSHRHHWLRLRSTEDISLVYSSPAGYEIHWVFALPDKIVWALLQSMCSANVTVTVPIGENAEA